MSIQTCLSCYYTVMCSHVGWVCSNPKGGWYDCSVDDGCWCNKHEKINIEEIDIDAEVFDEWEDVG